MMINIPQKNARTQTIAAVDVGTNTVRLLVVRGRSKSSFKILEQAQRITRLGEGMGRNIQEMPMVRTVAAITDFVKRAQKLQAAKIAVYATSAARRAENRAEFCERVHQATGVEPEIISGVREAELTFRGVCSVLPAVCKNAVILDIGGGSTEMICVQEGKVLKIHSLEIGAVSLTERFFRPADSIPENDLARFREYAEKALEKENIMFLQKVTWVGTAGTITTLAALDRQMVQYDPNRINGFLLSEEKVSRWLEILASMPLVKRRELAGLEPGRADIIVAGVGLVEIIMNHFHFDKILVSDAGFREGIIHALF